VADKKIIGIDLGNETLKCVVLSVASDKPEIKDCKSVSLNLSLDSDEAAWRNAVVEVLKSWKSENFIQPEDDVCVTVPNDQVLIRALKIKTEDIKNQLEAEADKQIPVSLSEVDWDSINIGEDNGQSHLVLAAVKKEIVKNILSIFTEAGIEPTSFDCGSIALGNLYLHSEGGEAKTPAAILSIGYSSSDLVVVDGKKIWIRSIPVTGKAIVSSLVKNLNLSEEDARKAITSGVNLAAPAGEESDVVKNVRATMTRIVMEITRSLTFFKAQIGGEKPQKILVCGGYSNIQGLTEFLSGRLKIETSSLDVFKAVDGGADNAYLFPQALGCALAAAELTPYSVNILPKEVQFQQMLDRKKLWISVSAYIFAAMFIALFLIVKIKSAPIATQYEKADAALSKVKALDGQIKKIQKQIDEKQMEIDELHRVILSRDLYVNVLNEISKIIPSNMWISSIENITFGDVYERDMSETEGGTFSMVVDQKSELYKRPVRLLIRGGYYGDWTAEMPKLQKEFAKLPGIAGFKQRQLTKEKKYSKFELDVDLDVNYNNIADVDDIKASHQRKNRSKRR